MSDIVGVAPKLSLIAPLGHRVVLNTIISRSSFCGEITYQKDFQNENESIFVFP